MNVDIHAHTLASGILADHGPELWRPAIIPHESGGYLIKNPSFTNGPVLRDIVEPDQIVAEMQAANVDLAVLSTPPFGLFYHLPPAEGEHASIIQNDGLAEAVTKYPQCLAGLGTVPLQDVPRAISELERVMTDLKLSGVEIGSSINGEDLGHDHYFPFWEAVEALGAVVLVHPVMFDHIGRDRMTAYYLRNLLGNPMETTQFAAHLIFSGVLEVFPRLKIVLSHAGGVLPYLRGRLERGYQLRAEPKQNITRPPSEYLGMFYYDTITHYGPTLQYLIDLVGADHVLLGSDYPFDMGYEQPVEFLNQLPELSPGDREKITGGNALRLLGRAT